MWRTRTKVKIKIIVYFCHCQNFLVAWKAPDAEAAASIPPASNAYGWTIPVFPGDQLVYATYTIAHCDQY